MINKLVTLYWMVIALLAAAHATIAEGNGPELGSSCVGHCGGQSPSGCWCDDACLIYNDCCDDICEACHVPFINNFDPVSGPTSGGTPITISGSSFGDRPGAATFDGVPMAVQSWTSNTVQALTPPGTGLNHAVQIEAVCGSNVMVSNMVLYSYASPVIGGISPESGPTSGGTLLTINGTNFGPAPGSATLGAASMTIQSWNHTQVQALTPPGVGLDQPVRIVTASGSSNPELFDYNSPAISDINPPSGDTSGGTLLTINGTNFGPAPGSATLGAAAMTIQSWNHTQVQALTPPGCGLNQLVQITTASGSSNTASFSYSPPYLSGDMNCSCGVDADDISEFVEALINPAGFSGCDLSLADVNGDVLINGADVQAFVDLLLP